MSNINKSNIDMLTMLGKMRRRADVVRRAVDGVRATDEIVRDGKGVGRADNIAVRRSRGGHTRPIRSILHREGGAFIDKAKLQGY